jgi:hypothetical protein
LVALKADLMVAKMVVMMVEMSDDMMVALKVD